MKANKVPAQDRLRQKIRLLEFRHEGSIGQKRGNPYNYCKGCYLHAPDISNNGHQNGCEYAGLRKEIRHYKELLWSLEHDGDMTGFYYGVDFL